MAKRRTRKQKQKAVHQFNLSWQPEPKNASTEPIVKGHLKNGVNTPSTKPSKAKLAIDSTKDAQVSVIKRNLVRSLIIVSLILALEVVIYLVWR
jgi:hypothetical protein